MLPVFISKYISEGAVAVDLRFSPDVRNNTSNPYIQRKQTSSEIKLCVIKCNDTGKYYCTYEEREVQKGMESQDTS